MRDVVLVILLVAAAAGCKSKESGAREQFSKKYTCPEDRVEVRERPDVKPSMLRPPVEPPPAIKADPARLELWKKEQEKGNTSGDSCEMFEARGCGEQKLLCCVRPPKHMDRVSCFPHDYANGVSRWQ